MDVTKSIQDAGYIAVGAGVIGFQQAQVRRGEIGSELARRAEGARSCAEGRLESFRSRVATRSATVRSGVEDWRAGVGDWRAGVEDQAVGAWERANDAATRLAEDLRDLVEPAVGEARVRVEPIVEQIQAVPDHLVRAADTGRSRVLGLVGSGTGSVASAA